MFLELCSHTSRNRHRCRFRSNAYKDVCLLRWRTYRKPISEFLEHLASYNGADMHKYNTLYIRTLSWHVLTPTSYYQTIVFKSKQNCRQTRRLRSSPSVIRIKFMSMIFAIRFATCSYKIDASHLTRYRA